MNYILTLLYHAVTMLFGVTAGAASDLPDEGGTPPNVYAPETEGIYVRVEDNIIPYRVFGIYTMPGEKLDVAAVFPQAQGQYRLSAQSGTIAKVDAGQWRWTAPEEHGLYSLKVINTTTGRTTTLNAFVLVPFPSDHNGLNGYRIGHYQQQPLRGNPVYNPPTGFIKVKPALLDVHVSPHFTLGQFLCKQESTYPKYLLLRERLLLKLEMILGEINEMGVSANTLHVMSGFRTPFYNKMIGNTTIYSRHLYGGAADIFLDVDDDNYMDDLNGDGRVDVADAQMLAGIIKENIDKAWYQPFIGGLGIYGANSHHGPFIHVDARGYKARW